MRCRPDSLVEREFFFFQAEDGIRDLYVTGVQTCALPICESTGPAIRNYPLNVVTEIIGTFVLVYGVLSMLVANKAGTFMIAGGQPLIVGLLVLAIGLSLGGPTGYAINPARDLGPRIAHAILPV